MSPREPCVEQSGDALAFGSTTGNFYVGDRGESSHSRRAPIRRLAPSD